MKKLLLSVFIASFVLSSGSAVAEEAPIYESLADVSIGRVFFTASQRANLDRLRGTSGVQVSNSGKPRSTNKKPGNPDAAGFIVSKSGKARVYRNGDFVEVSSEPNVKFPDDVTVTRKPSAEESVADDEAN